MNDDPLLEESLKPALLEKRFKRHRVSVLLLEDLDILRPLLGVMLPMMFLDVVNAELRPSSTGCALSDDVSSLELPPQSREASHLRLVETQCVCAA